jgi:hypothetical protein
MKKLRKLFQRNPAPGLAILAFLGITAALWLVLPNQSALPGGSPPDAAVAQAPAPIPVLAGPAAAAHPSAPAGVERNEDPNAIRNWLAEFRALTNSATDEERIKASLSIGLALAEQRRRHMVQLIREDPEQALREALRFDEYSALPLAVRELVERPFSDRAGYVYLPVCPGTDGHARPGAPDHTTELSLPDGTSAKAFTFGRKAGITSKRSLPASGIVLGGVAALHDSVFREIHPAERETVLAGFPAGQKDGLRSFATGKPVSGPGVLALAGGRVHAFENRAEMLALDAALAEFDKQPGPDSGSSVLFNQALPTDGADGFNLPAAEGSSRELASAWTETKKKVFLIRVDFSDHAGEPVSQAAASTEMNGPSSSAILAMSYGKTWVEAGASANVYRMPQTAAYYVGNNVSGELLRDARNTFRNTRSGADATVNIGPVSNTGNGGDSGLGDYDIVGVFFTSIGMGYAGLGSVGGGDLWIQDSNNTYIYVHEWGHNYGLFHASFWQTSDGSVVGAGSNDEYGDGFDVMGGGPPERGHFHTQGKSRLNWLTPNQWVDATATGSATHRVYRIDDGYTTNAIRGLRVTKSATPGSEEYYWLSYRPAFAENPHLQHGAYLVWQRPGESRCWLLDTTPGSPDGKMDAPMDPGRTYSDTAANLHITPLATGGAGSERFLDVRVNLGAFPGNHAPEITSLSGPSTVAARTNATFSLSATDSDGDTLAYWWNGQDGVVSANSNTITRSWTAGGTYPLAVTVSDMKGQTDVTNRTVTVTDPLDNWSQGSIGTTDDLRDIVYAKGRFVAAAYWGELFQSWDGTNWLQLGKLPDFEREPKLAFGANVFVVAGKKNDATAQIGCSPDGRIWSVASFPGGVPEVRDLAFGGGQFVAVGSSGTVLRSINGANWSVTTVSGLPDFRLVTWDGARWLAVAVEAGSGWPRRLWTSSNGVNWTMGASLDSDIFNLFSHGGTTYALGWYAGIKYSTDHGTTWLNALLPGTTQWTSYQMAAADDGTLLAVGEAMDETDHPRALLVSTDGRAWFRITGNTTAAYAEAMTFGFGRFHSVHGGGVTHRSASFHPDNHAPSASITSLPSSPGARQPVYFAASGSDADGDSLVYAWDFGLQVPVQDGFEIAPSFSFGGSYTLNLRVMDGRGGLATITQAVIIADPARTWTQRTSGTTRHLNAVAANASTLVAVGDIGEIRTSSNGVTWTERGLPDWDGNMYLHGAIWDGAQFIAVGYDYVSGWVGVIYTSPDGITWTRRYLGTADAQLRAVASSGTTRVAVGVNGTVLRSTDGTNWSPVTISALGTPSVEGVAFGNGTFVLTAFSGGSGTPRVFTSPDGLNWADYSSGAGLASWQDFRKIAWLHNRFVASGWYSKLRVSTNNAQTFSTTRTHTEELPAMAYTDGIWFTAGVDRDASSAAVDVLSLDGVNWTSFTAPTSVYRQAAIAFNHTFVTVGNDGSIWQSGNVTPAQGWPAWQATQFPAGGLSALADRDPDGDSLPNLVEYALGRDPNAAAGTNGAAALPSALMQSERLWMRLNLPDPAPADVNYVVMGAPNLLPVSWSTIARKNGTDAWQWLGGGSARLTPGLPSNGRVITEVGVPDSANGSPQYFLRLKLEIP